MAREKAIVVLSGGQDSTTCLFWAIDQGYEVHALTFDYNQRHKREVEAARKVATIAGAQSWECLALGPILKSTSPLVSDAPLEQYKDHESLPGGLEKTFVPMRNQLFLTIAANRAVAIDCPRIITGVCEEDFGGYPDCRQIFIDALEDTINRALYLDDSKPFTIHAPLMKLTKRSTVLMSLEFENCYRALAYSHTSYDGAYPPTGKDHATLLRAKGFEQAQVPDPLILRAWSENLMDLPATPNYLPGPVAKFMRWARLSRP